MIAFCLRAAFPGLRRAAARCLTAGLCALAAVASGAASAAEPGIKPPGEDLAFWGELFSGRVAVLPGIPGEALFSAPAGRALESALGARLARLDSAQVLDTNFFVPSRFPAVLYLGGEPYPRALKTPGDMDQALRRYLGQGGTLVILPSGPFPFYYDGAFKPVNGGAALGLVIGASSFEQPPAGRTLSFQAGPGQDLFSCPAGGIPYPPGALADPRWRSCTAPAPGTIRYTPFLTLRDDRGQAYGEGVAALEHTQGPLAGGRILFVACSLLGEASSRDPVLSGAFRYALSGAAPSPASIEARRAAADASEDAVWACAAPGGTFKSAGPRPRAPSRATLVKTRWDDSRLRVRFDCAGAPAAGESLAARLDRSAGATALLSIPAPAGGAASEGSANGAHWSTRVSPQGWTAIVSAPWSCFGLAAPPKLGAAMAAQFIRSGPGQAQPSVWSPAADPAGGGSAGALVLAADPFADDFQSHTNVLDPRTGWERQAGRWTVEDGTLLGEGCPGDLYQARGLRRGGAGWGDAVVTLRFKIESLGSDWRDGPWFGFRSRPGGDGYTLSLTAREAQLHKSIHDQSTVDANPLARAPWTHNTNWHTLQAELRGNRLSFQLDGRPWFQAQDNAHLNLPSIRNGGLVLSARQASVSQGRTRVRFDDVRARLLD